MDQMEDKWIVGPPEGCQLRQVLDYGLAAASGRMKITISVTISISNRKQQYCIIRDAGPSSSMMNRHPKALMLVRFAWAQFFCFILNYFQSCIYHRNFSKTQIYHFVKIK
jgi:hypothetical protein